MFSYLFLVALLPTIRTLLLKYTKKNLFSVSFSKFLTGSMNAVLPKRIWANLETNFNFAKNYSIIDEDSKQMDSFVEVLLAIKKQIQEQ